MHALHSILKKTGLTEKEVRIYISCLQYGQLTASSLARLTNIPRASIYDHASRLIKKWYLTQSEKNKTHYFRAVDPQQIYIFLNEQKNDFVDKVELFQEVIPQLQQLKTFSGTVPEIQYYEWKESLSLFFHHIAHAHYSYSIFSVDDLIKHIYFDIDELYKHLSNPTIKWAKRIVSYSETAKSYLAKQHNPNIQRKMLPVWYPMAAEITLYDGVLLQMSFGDNPSILEMKHPIYYQAHKTLFDYIRNSLP